MKFKRFQRLPKSEILKQLNAISDLRRKGFSVAKACKKVGVPVPTFYFRMKTSGAKIRKRAKPAVLKTVNQIDGRTLSALKRRRARHASVAGAIRKDLLELRKLGRRLLVAAKSLG